MNKRHINIPIFIPHLGCPNDCVFCNQRTISGKAEFNRNDVESEILRALETIEKEAPDSDVEIAYFGGSFTGIPRDEMIFLLETAHKYIKCGKVSSIRLSTRPDYISDEILDILKKYGVGTIELGIQSMSDKVLSACRRGHTSKQSKDACRKVVSRGFSLVGQMMTGLPEASKEDELNTARILAELGCNAARIYHTIVFHKTELCTMTKRGEYIPPSLDDAVDRAAAVLEIFAAADIPVIRLGLCASDELFDSDGIFAGAYHSAFGELVESKLFLEKLRTELKNKGIRGGNITITVPRGAVSKVVGQKRMNKISIHNEFGVKKIKVIENNAIFGYNILVEKNPDASADYNKEEKRCD